MKRLFYLLLFGLLLSGCDKSDSLNSAERNVISEDGSVPFEELLMLVNLKASDSTYLVVKSIDSVSLYVNNYYWSKVNSESIDTSKISKFRVDNQYQSGNKINYLIIADQFIKEPDYNTAGDFAQYLNNYYELSPGEYVCLIESFQVTFNDNTTKKYYPYEYSTFKVEQNSSSTYVGEIELKIK